MITMHVNLLFDYLEVIEIIFKKKSDRNQFFLTICFIYKHLLTYHILDMID